MPPAATVWKSYFKHEGQSQGHKVIDLCVIWKYIIIWVMHARYEASIIYGF